MFVTPVSYLASLSVIWFLFYWIFGGAVFAILAIFRLGRLSKARFSCLFTLVSAAVAYGAARLGVLWAGEEIKECIPPSLSKFEHFVAWLGCGIASFMLAFFVGVGIMLVAGFLALLLSSKRSPSPKPGSKKDSPSSLS